MKKIAVTSQGLNDFGLMEMSRNSEERVMDWALTATQSIFKHFFFLPR